MRASINIQLDEIEPEELHRFLAALNGSTTAAKVSGIVEGAKAAPDKAAPPAAAAQEPEPDAPPAAAAQEPEPDAPPPPAGEPETPKAKRGRPRKTPDAATGPTGGDDADGGEADAAPAPAAPKADAPKVTENAVKQAIAAAIKAKGIDGVRKIVASFKNAQGDPAAKLSDLQPQDYGAVVAALEAPDAE